MKEQEKITINIIQDLLAEQGKNKKDLCDHIGVSHSNFGNWVSGRNVSFMKYIHEIASFFGVSANYLLGYETPEMQAKLEKAREQMNSLRMMRYVPPRNAKKGHIEPKRTNLGQKENAPEYTEGERLLLDLFRSLPAERQELFLQMVKAFAEAQKQG